MTNAERAAQLEEARELLHSAVELVRSAVAGTEHERSAEAYVVAHLENWADGHNPHDETLPRLVEYLQGGSSYNLAWYRNGDSVGEETREFDNDNDAWHYAERQASSLYNADDFEALPVVNR